MQYIALLRGINVGGNRKVPMQDLKNLFKDLGFEAIKTYINSGNVLFDSEHEDEIALSNQIQTALLDLFGFEIPTAVVTMHALKKCLDHAPDWWGDAKDVKHNLIVVIQPKTGLEINQAVGEIKPEYEQIAVDGPFVFWSAPTATFSRSRWSKIVQRKDLYGSITIRNANTARKLVMMGEEDRGSKAL